MQDDREILDDWEIVGRHGNYRWWQAILTTVLGLFDPAGATSAVVPDSVTLTVRRKSTGAIHTVTAENERAALARIKSGLLDRR